MKLCERKRELEVEAATRGAQALERAVEEQLKHVPEHQQQLIQVRCCLREGRDDVLTLQCRVYSCLILAMVCQYISAPLSLTTKKCLAQQRSGILAKIVAFPAHNATSSSSSRYVLTINATGICSASACD